MPVVVFSRDSPEHGLHLGCYFLHCTHFPISWYKSYPAFHHRYVHGIHGQTCVALFETHIINIRLFRQLRVNTDYIFRFYFWAEQTISPVTPSMLPR